MLKERIDELQNVNSSLENKIGKKKYKSSKLFNGIEDLKVKLQKIDNCKDTDSNQIIKQEYHLEIADVSPDFKQTEDVKIEIKGFNRVPSSASIKAFEENG